jgi:hypothetical protein
VDGAHGFTETKDRAPGRVAKRQDGFWGDARQLFIEPRPARRDLVGRRRAVLRRTALHDVRDKTLRARYADLFFEKAKEQLAAATNEGLATFVLTPPRRFAYDQERRIVRTRSDHDTLASQ